MAYSNPAAKTYPRRYLSQDFDPLNLDLLKKEFSKLTNHNPQSAQDLESWIQHWEELGAIINDRNSHIHVATTVDTTDRNAEKDFLNIVENILPVVEEQNFQLSQKLLSSPYLSTLNQEFYGCFLRTIKSDASLFRTENLPLKTEEHKLVNQFEKIMGSMVVPFQGQEMTMQQVARFLEEADEAVRREAFEARNRVKLQHAPELEALYDQMLKVRQTIARNAGFANYRDYQFVAYHRFDYAPQDCIAFHNAIESLVVPVVKKLHQERVAKLGDKTLKPWNLSVDPEKRPAIRPFQNIEELVSGCQRIFNQVDLEPGLYFKHMAQRKLLDLDSRKGKAPGGYMTQFSETREPFIFMNAVGLKRDVDTLLHEGGHAFHYFLARDIHLPSYHGTGLEFAEVASMAMELLSRPYFNEFYGDQDRKRVLEDQLKNILEFFPFMAMIDAFQHWVYTSEQTSTASLRAQKWAELEKRFRPSIDWTGAEAVRDIGWQYPHVFSVPFYYVEYGIAQLGALAVWKQSLQNHREAVEKYKAGLSLGGSKPLPDLFKAVGSRFGLGHDVMAPLVDTLQRELMSSTMT